MYNFIVDLFSEEEYSSLLDDDESSPKDKKAKTLIVPPDTGNPPFVINNSNLEEEFENKPWLKRYSKRYFLFDNFISPTHQPNNNIGGNSALLSHSPTHYKLSTTFIDKNQDNNSEHDDNKKVVIKFPSTKIDFFETAVQKTGYCTQFPHLCNRVATFFRNFDIINPKNIFDLKEKDYIVFLVDESDFAKYLDAVTDYTIEKILKHKTFIGACDSCGKSDQLYMLTQGNLFDLGRDRKFLLRHPTRYKTNLTSKSSENFNICRRCAKQIYDFFEYIKRYKFYRYVFPTTIRTDTTDYKNYSANPLGILKMLKIVYNRNRFKEFDYVMMITDPKIEDIEFIYVNNFSYDIRSTNQPVNVKDIPLHSTLKEIPSKGKEERITHIQDERNKSIFLRELNLMFNNTLIVSLFETNPKELMTSLHPFMKLKIIEYNSIIRNFIYYQDMSFFEDRIYTKLFREILSELIMNSSLRDDMKVGTNKIRFVLTIYYKYAYMEPEGGDTITQYLALKEKMNGTDAFEIENDFEASYCMGQLFYYLLQVSKGQNTLDLFTKYTMNVHDMLTLKKKLVSVLEKYSHNEYLDTNRKFHSMIKSVLAFEFKKSYDDNKIPLYTGYFDNNYLYSSTKEKEEIESSGGEPDEL